MSTIKVDRHAKIPVLQFLIGRSLEETFQFLDAVRPSLVRVRTQEDREETTDSQLWRVTIYLNENQLVEKIIQEVLVCLQDSEDLDPESEKILRENLKDLYMVEDEKDTMVEDEKDTLYATVRELFTLCDRLMGDSLPDSQEMKTMQNAARLIGHRGGHIPGIDPHEQ